MADDKAKAKAIKDSRKKANDSRDTGRNDPEALDQAAVDANAQINPRKFIIINPPLEGGMNEARSVTKIDYLIRQGLGNQDHLTYYRKVMSDPKRAVTDPNLRKYVGEVLDEVLDIMFNDSMIYNRVRTILQREHIHETDLESPGGTGSDEVTKKYAEMTPGQSFELIKKALKGAKNG